MIKKNSGMIFIIIAFYMLVIACSQPAEEPEEKSYTIAFNKNDVGAEGTMSAYIAKSGSIFNLSANAFTKTGWTFAGWATSPGGTVTYADSALYTMGKTNKTLYAKWTPPAVYSLRDRGPAGGWIFYDKGSLSDGWRYLEAAPNDQTSRVWGSFPLAVTGADGTAIGTGMQNTLDITAGDTLADKAADECAGYSFVNGGITYDDWFLPSIDELNQMYINLKSHTTPTGGFIDDYYWSSTEHSNVEAVYLKFTDGGLVNSDKNNPRQIRAVRYVQ